MKVFFFFFVKNEGVLQKKKNRHIKTWFIDAADTNKKLLEYIISAYNDYK